jgi:hypothetical protein
MASVIEAGILSLRKSVGTTFIQWPKKEKKSCAAKAFYSCPAIISRRPESQKTPKEPQLNPEEEARIIQARSHVNSEKSSKNYKPSEE